MVTNRKVFGKHALSLHEAWEKYDLFQDDTFVSYMDEPIDVEPEWRDYTDAQTYSTKLWNDAYLAAFAHAADLEMVTFDKGFIQFQHTRCKILS